MKPFHLILLVLAGVGIATVISMYGNTTQYVAFPDAKRIAIENPGKAVHVVCKLNKAKPVIYDAQTNANRLVLPNLICNRRLHSFAIFWYEMGSLYKTRRVTIRSLC